MSTASAISRSALSDASSIIGRLAAGADDAPAVLAPERSALSHGELRRQMSAAAGQLHVLGIGRNDRVTGRLKEIINRGGEKISPLEVDDVLMDHPAVAQVVTFAMPHDKLGEEVAAAIVLREGSVAS